MRRAATNSPRAREGAFSVINPEGGGLPSTLTICPNSTAGPPARRPRPLKPRPRPTFLLIPFAEPDDFQALVFTDTQPTSPAEVGYLDRTIVAGLVGRSDFQFGVTLGDVTSNHPELYPAINATLARLGIPWHAVNGNHDLDLGAADDRSSVATFESVYGPSTYAFTCGRALFIALNDVRFLGGPRYVGGLRPDQWTFLENLLRITPSTATLIVTLMHIPLFSPDPSNAETFRATDRARLFALLRDRPHVLLLSGHTHYQRHVFYDRADGWQGSAPLEEDNVAAACGSFWGGPLDASGLPLATMADGTPHGYGILFVHGTETRLDYQPARHPASYTKSGCTSRPTSRPARATSPFTPMSSTGTTAGRSRLGWISEGGRR